jgi:hypothetical protein
MTLVGPSPSRQSSGSARTIRVRRLGHSDGTFWRRRGAQAPDSVCIWMTCFSRPSIRGRRHVTMAAQLTASEPHDDSCCTSSWYEVDHHFFNDASRCMGAAAGARAADVSGPQRRCRPWGCRARHAWGEQDPLDQHLARHETARRRSSRLFHERHSCHGAQSAPGLMPAALILTFEHCRCSCLTLRWCAITSLRICTTFSRRKTRRATLTLVHLPLRPTTRHERVCRLHSPATRLKTNMIPGR